MLDAAEALLAGRGFDEVSVAEIARRAGVTIGAFYARFSDKEALLEALEERVTDAVLATVSRATDPRRWEGTTVEAALRSYCRELVEVYRATRGAGRALVLRSRSDPALKRRLLRLNSEGPPRVLEFLLAHGRIRHPDPKRALQVALLAVRSTLRELILFGETWPGGSPLPPDLLAEELTRLFLGYLGIHGRQRLQAGRSGPLEC
jgi:AcrR family transcriptional regulator